MSDAASTEWFGQLAYMSWLLGPDAPKKTKHWSQLSEQQREWFRAAASAEIASLNDGSPQAQPDSDQRQGEQKP